jgi:ribosome-binding protein aMBF1 (putative translation factor)
MDASSTTPIGVTVQESIRELESESAEFRAARGELAPFEEIARMAILRRAELGLSQREVADRMGSTASVVSRIESGQHRTGPTTLKRLAEALDGHAVVGFEFKGESSAHLVRL